MQMTPGVRAYQPRRDGRCHPVARPTRLLSAPKGRQVLAAGVF